eukprot:PhM_4_TR7613/c0_g1_i1/m.33271/K08857/NEK1_4_5; NIMA (never in mitosis gene a)-related kinase 1/4/5
MADDDSKLDSELFRSKYRKIKMVGKGSFGEAVLVRSREDGKRYISKAIDTASMTPKELRDVQREIEILAKVNHPNIVRYREHFQDGSLMFIIMEYADGGDLSTRIKDQKKRSPDPERPVYFDDALITSWFLQICMALKYLHDHKILHRDLKTANVFLTSKNVVKLGDFGISTVLQNTVACANTVCGTPYYFSPEICHNRPYNNKSDVWAIGVVLFEMITLRRPFNARGLKELMKKIVVGTYEPLQPGCNPSLSQLVAACLTVSPSQRPSVNRILETPFVQDALKVLSKELMQQAETDKKTYEDRKKVEGDAKPNLAAPPRAATVDAAAQKAAEKEQLQAMRGMDRGNLRAMMAQQAASGPQQAATANPTGVPKEEDDGKAGLDEDGDVVANKNYLVEHIGNVVGKGKLGGHDEEFGDAEAGAAVEMILMPDGQTLPAPEAKTLMEKEVGPALFGRATDYISAVLSDPSPPSNAEIQRELARLLNDRVGRTTSTVFKVIMWDSKQV